MRELLGLAFVVAVGVGAACGARTQLRPADAGADGPGDVRADTAPAVPSDAGSADVGPLPCPSGLRAASGRCRCNIYFPVRIDGLCPAGETCCDHYRPPDVEHSFECVVCPRCVCPLQ